MKKVLALIFVVVFVLGMTVHAFALEESHVDWEKFLPILSEDSAGLVILYSMNDVQNMTKEAQELMEEASEKLEIARPEHLALKYFCYVGIIGSEDSATVVFAPIKYDEIQFKQYVDGAWTVCDFTVNEDGTIAVNGVVNAPLAVFINDEYDESADRDDNKLDSASADEENLLPHITDESSTRVLLHSTEMVPQMPEEIQKLMADAKAKLKDACPPDCAVKFFCYVEILGSEGPVSVVMEEIDYNEIHFDQYVNGTWAELPFDVNEDGTITVNNVVEGPMAIFIK